LTVNGCKKYIKRAHIRVETHGLTAIQTNKIYILGVQLSFRRFPIDGFSGDGRNK